MTADNPDYGALARAVVMRRTAQGLTAVEVQARGGPSVSTLTAIENGTGTSYTAHTFAKLDRGLDWEPGSATGVLAGRDPVESRRAVKTLQLGTESHSVSLRLADGTTFFVVGDAPMTPEREELLLAALGRRTRG